MLTHCAVCETNSLCETCHNASHVSKDYQIMNSAAVLGSNHNDVIALAKRDMDNVIFKKLSSN